MLSDNFNKKAYIQLRSDSKANAISC